MNKSLIAIVAVVIALGVAIYFFQGKVVTVAPTDTTPEPSRPAPTNTMPIKDLPPAMEDGTIDSSSTSTPNIY